MATSRRNVATVLAALAVALPAPAAARAQASRPLPTSLPSIPYADHTFGFELRVPDGWGYERTRFAGPGESIGLLRGAARQERATLQILVYRSLDGRSFPDWLDTFERNIATISGTQTIARTSRILCGRESAILEVDAQLGADVTKTYYGCVPFDSTTVWVLAYAAVASSPAARQFADHQFEQLIASLRVLYDPDEGERLVAALQRGRTLLVRLRAHAAEFAPEGGERFYDIALAGKPIGYLRRRIARENREFSGPGAPRPFGKEGVRVEEESWRFGDDGTARHSRVDLFASFDLETELIETRGTQVPPAGSAERLLITLDQVVREEQVLFSSFSTNRDEHLPDPRPPLKVGGDYLGLAWVRLLPRLLGTEPGELHAFSIYDSPTRALISQTIRALGPRPLPGGAAQSAFGYEMREGFAGQPATLSADDEGNLLRYEDGDLVISASTEKAIEHRYAARRNAARSRLQGKPD